MITTPIYDIGCHVDPTWNTCVNLIEPHDELPRPDFIHRLYLDFETTSQNPDIASTNPHKNCKILGICLLWDDQKFPYYIPIRHSLLLQDGSYQPARGNYSIEKVHDWLKWIGSISKEWINHNIKYDAHVFKNELGIWPKAKLIDTLVLSKLASFEERFTYNLTEMMRLIGIDISPYEEHIHESLGGYKDYGLIPIDRMASYGSVDVLAVRHLYFELLKRIDAKCERVVNMELELTNVLLEIEQRGLRFDPIPAMVDWARINRKQSSRLKRIKQLSGLKSFDPSKKRSQKELFVETLGWDIDLTDKTRERLEKFGYVPDKEMRYSFGYASIYKHAKENPRIVATWINYLEDEKLLSSFILPYLNAHADSMMVMRPSFNQIVRTGRMSCSNPNMQQLSPRAKVYIVPWDKDYVLAEFDLSQIEFRVIVHYIENQRCIRDYNENPDTDFHDWVAGMCGIKRKAAKNINFMLGYGGGREKCVKMLSELPDIVGNLRTQEEVNVRANNVYESYHYALPELKPTQRRCGYVLCDRGYVRTLLGRHRHLPPNLHFKSFNSVCQGFAADIQKDITLRLRKFFSDECLLHALVHDSWLFSIHKSRVNELVPLIKEEIERPIEGVKFSVPIRSSVKVSDTNWSLCE